MQQDSDPKHTAKTTKSSEVEGLRVVKSVSRLKPYSACILHAKEKYGGTNALKQTRSCGGNQGKHHKRKVQKFGDANWLQA